VRKLPSGTVTFLFTDVEGSTKLLHELGEEEYAEALAEHRRVVRNAFAVEGGVEVDTQGDAFFIAFPTAPGALRAVGAIREALAAGPIRVRAGLHTGTPLLTEEGYVGHDVHRAARIASVGHGGQILVSSATAALGSADGLRDLGEHRLKDLSAPERIYQLGGGDFPALNSLYQTNLPIPATPFLGREREVEEIATLLTREEVRLVTLTGPGGTGKTRLGLQSAGAAADAFPAGVWWAPLAPLRDPALVLDTAADAVGTTAELHEFIADKRLLLFFDNFEHVVDAAADVGALVRACPKLTVLVTSREPLHVEGETDYAVDPMRESEAVALFETRARAAKRDFTPNDESRAICARLDNLPLAIELAAARVKAMSAAALLERLEQRLPVLTSKSRDAPERQRTLRATIEWSHDLLDEDEKTLFRRLGAFAGGATLETIEDVCEDGLETLASLVDKSLVRIRDGDRYWMLETIREFALEQLEASNEFDAVRARHANHFLALAEAADPHLPAFDARWIGRLDAEHDNLRAALHWLSAHDAQRAMELAALLARYWLTRGSAVEGRRHLDALLTRDPTPTPARAKALAGRAMIGDDESAAAGIHEEAVALNRDAGDPHWLAVALLGYAMTLSRVDFAKAAEVWTESAQLFAEAGDEHYVVIVNRHLAWAYANLGDEERALALHEANLERTRELGNRRMESILVGVLAAAATNRRDFDRARELLAESYRLHHEIGDPMQTALAVFRYAFALAARGDARAAAKVWSAADALFAEAGGRLAQWDTVMIGDVDNLIRTRIDDAEFARAWEEGRELSAEEAVAVARSSF
jgi:predicted ATPase